MKRIFVYLVLLMLLVMSSIAAAGNNIRGIVVNEKGEPQSNMKISHADETHGNNTDRQGKFEFVRPAPGTSYENVIRYLAAYDSTRKNGGYVVIPNAEEDISDTTVRIVVHPTYSIKIKVVDYKNEPLKNASISLSTLFVENYSYGTIAAYTDSKGIAKIDALLKNGKYGISAILKGYYFGNELIIPIVGSHDFKKNITLKMTRLNRIIKGKVLDRNMKPIAGVHISLDDSMDSNVSTISDKHGKFTLTGMPDKAISINGWKTGLSGNATITRKQKTVTIVLTKNNYDITTLHYNLDTY